MNVVSKMNATIHTALGNLIKFQKRFLLLEEKKKKTDIIR